MEKNGRKFVHNTSKQLSLLTVKCLTMLSKLMQVLNKKYTRLLEKMNYDRV